MERYARATKSDHRTARMLALWAARRRGRSARGLGCAAPSHARRVATAARGRRPTPREYRSDGDDDDDDARVAVRCAYQRLRTPGNATSITRQLR